MEEKDRIKDKKTSHKPKKDNVIITVLKKHKIGILLVIFLFMGIILTYTLNNIIQHNRKKFKFFIDFFREFW